MRIKTRKENPNLSAEIEWEMKREMGNDEGSDGGREGGKDAENIRKRSNDRYAELHEAGTQTKRWKHRHVWKPRYLCLALRERKKEPNPKE